MKTIDFNNEKIKKMYSVGMYYCNSDHFIINKQDIFINPNFHDMKDSFFNDYEFDPLERVSKDHEYSIFLYDIIHGMADSAFLWFVHLVYNITGKKVKIYIPERAMGYKRLIDELAIDGLYELITFRSNDTFKYIIDDTHLLFMQYDKDGNLRMEYFVLRSKED